MPACTMKLQRDGRLWRIVVPACPGEGMGTELGPYLTWLGARLSLAFNQWLAR